MKKVVFVIIALTFLSIFSCTKKEPPLTPLEEKARSQFLSIGQKNTKKYYEDIVLGIEFKKIDFDAAIEMTKRIKQDFVEKTTPLLPYLPTLDKKSVNLLQQFYDKAVEFYENEKTHKRSSDKILDEMDKIADENNRILAKIGLEAYNNIIKHMMDLNTGPVFNK